MLKGKIHSIETMGTVDGPGIRYVLFMQGCPMRCIFCHNRDTWDIRAGQETTVEEVVEDFKKYVDFMKFSGGGITVTGGEPTLQAEFVTELFKQVKAMGLTTVLDTSGFVQIDRVKELLKVTDLILLSIKHIDEVKHKEITGVGNKLIHRFIEYLAEQKIPVWIRYVIIPGWTDDPGDIARLAEYLAQFGNIERVEVLPYHTLGVYKWEQFGEEYKLKDVLPPTSDEVKKAKEIFQQHGLKT